MNRDRHGSDYLAMLSIFYWNSAQRGVNEKWSTKMKEKQRKESKVEEAEGLYVIM